MKSETRMSVVEMCAVAGFARADMDLREAMHQTAFEWPSYGSWFMMHELKARGWEVNRKRAQGRMREDNLLCVMKRKFVVTTDSAHGSRNR